MLENEDASEKEQMHFREITLADGRYMIFYTFGDEDREADKENDQGEDV